MNSINYKKSVGLEELCENINKSLAVINSEERRKKILSLIEEDILDRNNYLLSYFFAKVVPGADIKKHEDIVIQSGDMDIIIDFTYNPRVDIEMMEKFAFESGNAFINFYIARDFHYISIENFKKHENVVIESRDLHYNFEFAKLPGADIKRHEEVVIESRDPFYNVKFAKLPGADIRKHEDAVIESGNSLWCSVFAREVPGADIKRLNDAIVQIEEAEKTSRSQEKFNSSDCENPKQLVWKSFKY